MQDKIKNLIKDTLKNLNIEGVDFGVEHPEDLKNGDYSTNVAMVCAKKLKINLKELAEKIVENLKSCIRQDLTQINLTPSPLLKGEGEIEKIQIAGAGFINFYL